MEVIKRNIKGDYIIWIVIMVFSVFSILSVYSSTGSVSSSWSQVIKHCVVVTFSLAIIYVVHIIPYTYFSRLSIIALALSFPIVIITAYFGPDINSARRSIEIPGIGMNIQTFDIAKIALIMYIARILSKNQDNPSDLKKSLLPILIPTLALFAIIVKPDFSTASLIVACVFIFLFIGRVKLSYILTVFAIFIVLIISVYTLNKYNPSYLNRMGTWEGRITAFLEPDPTFHADSIPVGFKWEDSHYTKMAINAGGLLGVLPGNSSLRNNISNPSSDFIFAIIVEEYGLFAGIFIILCYLIILLRAIKIANKTPRYFGTLLVIGCTLLIIIQAFINIAYTVSLFPTTGLPLPFISIGGMSLWMTAICVGIILSVSREINDEKLNKTDAAV